MRLTLAHTLLVVAPLALLAGACSGTSIRPSTDTAGTDADGGGGGGAATQEGGAPVTGNDAGIVLPATCPCPTGSYCDLATNTCKIGCTDSSQCAPSDTCDVSTRTCETPKAGLSSCPIPAAAAADGGAACNGVTPLGKDVTQTCKMGTLPVAKGGAVRDGVYVLTSTDFYSATCQSGTYASTIYVCNGTWAISQGGTVATSASSTATATFSGTSMTLTTTCGGTGAGTATPYDATDTGITIYTASGIDTGGYADHYTRQ